MAPKKLPKFLKPSFLSRLSQVVFLQIIFVFGALAIVLLFPSETPNLLDRSKLIEERLESATNRLNAIIGLEWLQDSPTYFTSALKDKIALLLRSEDWITQADVYVSDLTGRQVLVFSYQASSEKSGKVQMKPLGLTLKSESTGSVIGPVFAGGDYLIYYYPFLISKKNQAFLSAAVHHNMIVSSRDNIQDALLLIFLGATLISLFTVYLVMKWFHNPLSKLIQRFSKTAQGGIYYQLEAEGDEESDKLAQAFNEMSAQLYDNKRELKEYLSKLNEANRSLVTSKGFLLTLINNSPNCLIVASEDRQIMISSKEALKTFGFESEREIIGRDIQEFFAQSAEDLVKANSVNDEQSGAEALCWKQNKTMFPAFVSIAPIIVGEDNRKAFLYIVRDISDSKSFQQMMIRLNRNYTRGEMAGDLAHDLNNYLAILMGNLELIPLFLKKNQMDKVDQKFEQMKGTLDKIAKYASGLMDSNHDELVFEKTHINQIIENVLAFIKPQKRFAGIAIETNLSTEIPAFDADANKIQQMMVNLLSNSSDAVTSRDSDKKIEIRTILSSDPGMFRLEITDNGPGVLEEKRSELFKSRFTTKRKGHGIGLITCRKIVDAHRGKIGCEFSDKTMFFVELPLTQTVGPKPSEEFEKTATAPTAVS